MVVIRRGFAALAVSLILVAGSAAVASAGHHGNNGADLVGTGDPDAAGHAVLNYSTGAGTYAGAVTVRNLEPGETYTLLVRNLVGGEQVVCTGTANAQGVFACQAQGLTLGPFVHAAVEDAGGGEVASAAFERRGDCREPEQVGSQCAALAAPGQNQ